MYVELFSYIFMLELIVMVAVQQTVTNIPTVLFTEIEQAMATFG